MIHGVECPFCGGELRRGWVRARGVLLAGFWAYMIQVTFEVMDGSRDGWVVFSPGWFGRRRRRARACVRCDAVIVDPTAPTQ
jgi:hypothetical protein